MTLTASPHPIDVLMVGPMPAIITEHLERHYRLHRWWEIDDKTSFIQSHGQGIRAIVTSGRHGATRELIESLPKLEAICSQGVGYDSIDIHTAQARGIIVTNTPNVLNACVADTALGLVLNVSRQFCQADRFVREGRWENEAFALTTKPSGKRCGIVGLGSIGLEVAKRAAAFDMTIAYYNRNQRRDVPPAYHYYNSLVALAENSDFLIVVVPGGAQTRHLINDDILNALGPKGYLINVSRGSVVEETALIRALEEKRIAGAGLDVFEHEPTVPLALRRMENVVLLPHLASGTEETRQAMADLVINNLDSWFSQGQVTTRVV